jgi:exodeoxyribonuclease VII small subunit
MTTDLDAKMKELRAIVGRLESGKLPLEQALAEYERGARLGREIDAALALAEQKVDLLKPDGTLEPLPRTPA